MAYDRGWRSEHSSGVGCSGSSLAAAGSGAAGWHQRRWKSDGGGGSTVLAAARWQRWRQGSPITPATALPIPLLIAAARLGDVAVSLCSLRSSGRLRGDHHLWMWTWCGSICCVLPGETVGYPAQPGLAWRNRRLPSPTKINLEEP
jgi:hypothetical protein